MKLIGDESSSINRRFISTIIKPDCTQDEYDRAVHDYLTSPERTTPRPDHKCRFCDEG